MAPVVEGPAFADADPVREAPVLSFADGLVTMASVKIPGSAGELTKAAPKASGSAAVTATTFHDDTLPDSGWISIDQDGDGHGWEYARTVGSYFYSLEGLDGECITSASFINGIGALTPDNWLVSPAFKVPENTQIQFYVSGQDPKYCQEHYGVYISTSSQTDTSAFTELYTETVDSGGGIYKGKAVDLTAYAGQTVYVAFRHFGCTDMYWLNLDGVGLAEAGTVPAVPARLIRVKGKTRYDTSIQVALQLLNDLGASCYPNAIIATGDSFPDALAGSALSTTYSAPVLLISEKSADSIDNAIDFIRNYVHDSSGNPGTVFILGGKKAVPESVESKLEAIGYTGTHHVRFAGKGRYETNLAVLEYLRDNGGGIEEMIFCDGTNWPDAATASAVGYPIMLVAKSGLDSSQKAFLDSLGQFWVDVIGGKSAVPDQVLNSLAVYDKDGKPLRVFGKTRADTAVCLASTYWKTSEVDQVTFAYGANFPDCIAGGLLANCMSSPILYGDSNAPASYAEADLPYMASSGARSAYILGGEKLIADDFVYDLMEDALSFTS